MIPRSLSLFTAVLLVSASIPVDASEMASANEPPLVDAGLDRTVQLDTRVLLDGGGSRDPDGRIVSYQWSIETPDGRAIVPENRSAVRTAFEAAQIGTYRVTLAATDSAGATREDTLYVHVARADPPTVRIRGPDRVVVGATVQYRAEASDRDGRIVTISWGDGSTGASIRRQFQREGAVRLEVTVTDDDGQTATATKTVHVQNPNRQPRASIRGPSRVVQGTTETFTVRASDRDGRVSTIEWDRGVSSRRLSHTFDEPIGSLVTFRAIVRDDDGAEVSATKSVRVVSAPSAPSIRDQSPTVSIDGPVIVDPGSTEPYVANAMDPDGVIVRYDWDDGATSRTITRTFSADPGTDIELGVTVTDDDGRTATDTHLVHVRPTVSIRGPECVEQGSVQAYSAETKSESPIVEYSWDNAETSPLVGQQATHLFDEPVGATVVIGVTVQNAAGVWANASKETTVCPEHETNEGPSITTFSAQGVRLLNGDFRISDPDAFAGSVVATDGDTMDIRFGIRATDPEADILTYTVVLEGEGVVEQKAQSGQPVEFTRRFTLPQNFGMDDIRTTRTVSLTVSDSGGEDTTVTETISFRIGPTSGPQGDGNLWLNVDKLTVSVGDPVEITVGSTLGTNPGARSASGYWLLYGDGERSYIRGADISSDGSPHWQRTTTHRYNSAGEKTIQVAADSESSYQQRAEHATIFVVAGKQYTEYHWRKIVEPADTTVAAVRPGADYIQGDLKSRTVEVYTLREAVLPHNADQLGNGWRRIGTKHVRVRDGERHIFASRQPDPRARLVDRRVRQDPVFDRWEYRTFEERAWHADGLEYVGTVSDVESVEESIRSATRPAGTGWTRGSQVGTARAGWDYQWFESIPWSGDWRYVRSQTTTREHEHGHDHDKTCFYGFCTGHDHETWMHTHEDTSYLYRTPDYDPVYEWSRTVTKSDTDYRYRVAVYDYVWVHKWALPNYETKTHHVYEKDFRDVTEYYEWTRPAVLEQMVTRRKPMDEVVFGKLDKHSHRCGEEEGGLQRRVCPSIK